jgi:hypothetical protein
MCIDIFLPSPLLFHHEVKVEPGLATFQVCGVAKRGIGRGKTGQCIKTLKGKLLREK